METLDQYRRIIWMNINLRVAKLNVVQYFSANTFEILCLFISYCTSAWFSVMYSPIQTLLHTQYMLTSPIYMVHLERTQKQLLFSFKLAKLNYIYQRAHTHRNCNWHIFPQSKLYIKVGVMMYSLLWWAAAAAPCPLATHIINVCV